MRDDEFTNSKSNNESFISKSEYANLPDSEFSDSGEMNLHKAAYDASLMKSQNSKTVEDVTQGAGAEATVASSASASGIAAGTVSTIVAASSVAVVAIGVLTGISVALHDYSFSWNSFIVSSNQLRYDLTIIDNEMKEDDYEHWSDQNPDHPEESSLPFLIRVYNNNYDSSQELYYFSQSGVFSNLTLGAKYHVTVSENKFNGQIIYDDTFITYVNSSLIDFRFNGDSDFENGTFEIYMDVIDEKDIMDSYKIDLYEPDAPEKILASFDLEEKEGYQNISYLGSNNETLIDITKEYGYTFSYMSDGELVEYKKDKVTLFDMYGRVSKFNGFIFDKTYNYKEGTMDVRLDYQDYFGWYDNFVLTLTAHYVEGDPTGSDGSQTWTDDREIELQATSDIQTIDVMGLDLNLMDPNVTFTYVLTANYRGVTTTLAEESEPFTLTDNSGAKSEWNKFIFDKTANFLDATFEVQLDYVDDFYYYDDFTLTLLPSGVNAQYDFHLDATTDVQTCTFDAQQHWNYSFDYEYSYSLTCTYQGAIRTLDSGENFKFTDTSGFLGLDFDGTYDYGTNDFSLKLNYEDPDNNFSNFVFHLTYEDEPSEPSIDISLEKTTEVQSFDLDDYGLYTGTWYMYNLTCDYKGNAVTLVTGEESFQFSDPDLVPTTSITFVNNEMNYHDGTMWVQFDYTDKYNMISSAWLVFYGKNSEEQDDYINESSEIYLEVTKDPQEINIADINTGEEDGIDFTKYNLAYDLYYEYYTDTDTDTSSLYGYAHPITLTNSAKTEVSGYESKFQVFPEMDSAAGYEKYRMWINFDAIDENNMWSSYKAYWEGENENGTTFQQAVIEFDERELGGWHKVTIQCEGENDAIFNGEGWDLVIIADVNNPYTDYSAVDEEIYRIENTKPVYVEAPDPEIFDVGFSDTVISGGDDNWSLTAFPTFAGDETQFTDFAIIFEQEDGTTYTYSLTFTSYFDFYVNDPDEGEIDVNVFTDVPFKISIRYRTVVNGVTSELITKVVATNKSFGLSVQLI